MRWAPPNSVTKDGLHLDLWLQAASASWKLGHGSQTNWELVAWGYRRNEKLHRFGPHGWRLWVFMPVLEHLGVAEGGKHCS